MRCLLILTILFSFTSICVAQQQSQEKEAISLSDPVESTEQYEIYGSDFEASGTPLDLENLISKSDAYKDQQVVTRGQIKQVCQKKGCFFILADGQHEARITFKDYSFFIPTNTAGKKVVLKGMFNVKKLSEEKAKHYAEDAGEDSKKITGLQEEYSLVATSVKIWK